MSVQPERVVFDGISGLQYRDKDERLFFPAAIEPKSTWLKVLNLSRETSLIFHAFERGREILLHGQHTQNPKISISAHYREGKFARGTISRLLVTDDSRFPDGKMSAGFQILNDMSVGMFMGEGGSAYVNPRKQMDVIFSCENAVLYMRDVADNSCLLCLRRQGVRLLFGEDPSRLVDVNFYSASADAMDVARLLWSGVAGEDQMTNFWTHVNNISTYIFQTPAERGSRWL